MTTDDEGTHPEAHESIPFGPDDLHREMIGAAVIVRRFLDDYEDRINSFQKQPDDAIRGSLYDLRVIESAVVYLMRLMAIYGNGALDMSLSTLGASQDLTPSAVSRRINADLRHGLGRPERWLQDRDADAFTGQLSRYELMCEEAGVYPWPALEPLPDREPRQRVLRALTGAPPPFRDDLSWEQHRDGAYRQMIAKRNDRSDSRSTDDHP